MPLEALAALAPIQTLQWQALNDKGISVSVKREDLLDRYLGGNKFYKLYGHIQSFKHSKQSAILSFGGAYSNHIYALAAAGKRLSVPTVGVIRGERPSRLSPTLQDAEALGMQLKFVSRSEYRLKHQSEFLENLKKEFGTVYFVPEGGGDILGAKGCAAWAKVSLKNCGFQPTHICVAAGTGGTLSGLLAASPNIPIHGFLAIKGKRSDYDEFYSETLCRAKNLQEKNTEALNLKLETQWHCGGYGKYPEELKKFVTVFEEETQLPVDPVYTAKMFWGIFKMAEQGLFPEGSRLLVFHTGGLQGRRGVG